MSDAYSDRLIGLLRDLETRFAMADASIQHTLKPRMHGIREALQLFQADIFIPGICLTCGEEISSRRLELLPEAIRCTLCAGAKERGRRVTVSASL